jgi:DNA invertase Pin-like site-specific DNA recombinase
MNRVESNSKITPNHLARKAIVYLRQSSIAQVKYNTESQRLQYALKDTAIAYGFARVEVIDCDLGFSASSGAQAREGFKQLLASIALGEVGMVLSREPSRLSRTDKDWCQLMELCRVLNTLIGDAESVYDLNRLDDQLILGIKGTLSVVELGTLKVRLQQGREAKAKRGELGRSPQPGYVMDEATRRLVKDPNLRVQEAIALVFSRFEALGSLRQTHLWFHQERIELPVNKPHGGHFRLEWKLPSPSFLGDILNNPMYAGAYVYGRRPSEVVVRDGQALKRQGSPRAAHEASVFIAQHHEAYVSWAVYQRNLATLRGNGSNFAQDDAAQIVRGGQGLLSGLLRCARCGHKLNIRYWGKQGTAARYLCSGDFQTGGSYCLGFGGASVDRRVSEVILEALSPYGMQASIAAIVQSRAQGSERRGALERQLQQARYEAERAFAQYDQTDPANRLVAEVLEQRWNVKLAEQQRVEQALGELNDSRAAITPANEASLLALGQDFASVWHSEACPMTFKKRITRTLIKEIVVDVVDVAEHQELNLIIHWQGGCHTALSMPKPLSGAIAHKTALQDVELITTMARRYRDDEIARVLSKLGRRTGKGNRWNQYRVATVRRKYHIAAPTPAELDPDLLNLAQACRYSSVSDTTIMRLIKAKLLNVAQAAPYAPLEIKRFDLDSEPVAGILAHLRATGRLILDGDQLAPQTSLF